MKIVLDTNLLLRVSDPGRTMHAEAMAAVDWLHAHGHECVLVPQVLYEYWVVATRPTNVNGLGMEPAVVNQAVEKWADTFTLLLDERGVFSRWLDLVTGCDVKGKNAHDARLVASMQRHGVTTLVTFNVQDFARFAGIINVYSPTDVLNGVLTTPSIS